MRTSRIALALLSLPLALSAQGGGGGAPAAPPTDPLVAVFRGRINGLERNIAIAFDSIPESKFSYKPTPAQLTIGYVAQHLANDNYLFCNAFGDMKATRPADETSTPDSVKATWPKAKLVASLKESFTFCQAAAGQLVDSKLTEMVELRFGANARQVPRAQMVLGHALDLSDHYSQLANYMRLNGILPPSALPRPAARP